MLLWLKNCLPFQNGWRDGNAATALWQVTQQTAALLLLSLPWMPGNQLDEGSNFLICKPTLLHFGTDFLRRCLCNFPEPWERSCLPQPVSPTELVTLGLGNDRQLPSPCHAGLSRVCFGASFPGCHPLPDASPGRWCPLQPSHVLKCLAERWNTSNVDSAPAVAAPCPAQGLLRCPGSC